MYKYIIQRTNETSIPEGHRKSRPRYQIVPLFETLEVFMFRIKPNYSTNKRSKLRSSYVTLQIIHVTSKMIYHISISLHFQFDSETQCKPESAFRYVLSIDKSNVIFFRYAIKMSFDKCTLPTEF